MGAAEVGVGMEGTDEMVVVWTDCADTDLNDVNRFCAEDLRRIEGRWVSRGAMDILTEVKDISHHSDH